jgi:hypothetical protein
MSEQTCPKCRHPRRVHSKEGCTDAEYKNGKWVECPCKQKYMDIR